jgi:hypothetical protein
MRKAGILTISKCQSDQQVAGSITETVEQRVSFSVVTTTKTHIPPADEVLLNEN